MPRFATTALSLSFALAALPAAAQEPVQTGPENRPDVSPAFPEQTNAPALDSGVTLASETVVSGLEHPWGIAVLPGDQGYLVTERSGTLRHVSEEGVLSEPIAGIPAVFNEEQGGLLDIALDPEFGDNRRIYWTYSKPLGEGRSVTAAARGTLTEDLGTVFEVEDDLFNQTPPSPTPMHYGSRIIPDGDGHIYITTGEHFTPEERQLAQGLDNTYGKIVRLSTAGNTPDNNPFADRGETQAQIWSYGHRNIQGAALEPETGQLWAIEHGPQGGDELNRIEPGQNYGWPEVSYGENYDGSAISGGAHDHEEAGFTPPRYYWDPVIAPGGMTFYEGDMFEEWQGDLLIAALVADGIVRLELDGDTVTGEERLATDLGRVRDVAIDSDGSILVATDYEDGELIRLTAETASN